MVDNVSGPLKSVRGSLDNTTKGFESFAGKLVSINSAIQLVSTSVRVLQKALTTINQYVDAYRVQMESELKLETVMRQRMNATEEEIQSIKELASAEQQRGIYGDEMILQGAQQLSMYASNKRSVEALIPAMNNLIAQQRGMNATTQDFDTVAKTFGKALAGNSTALLRMGIVLTDAEKQMISYGTEEQRASKLAEIITSKVGEMNSALAGTNAGAMIQAKNAIGDFREEIGKILEPVLTVFYRIETEIITRFREPILNAIQTIVNHLPDVVNGLLNIATVIAPVAMAWAIAWAVMNWPITLVIASIGLLIEILGTTGIVAGKAGEIIGGAIGGIKAVFINAYNIIYNIITGLANIGVSMVEFIVNAWKKFPTFIYGLFDKVLAMVGKVAGVMDRVFGTNLTKSIDDQRKNLQEFISTLQSEKVQFERFEPKQLVNIIDEVKSGAKTGAEFENWIRSKLSEISISTGKSASAVNGSGNLDVEEQNEIKIDDDYKSLLAEQAVRQYQLSYATITPDFSIENLNVSNEADVDSIFERIADKISELTQTYIKKG